MKGATDAAESNLQNKALDTAIDGLGACVCVLDMQGVIRWVNAAWREFASRNGGDAKAGVGASYVDCYVGAEPPFIRDLRALLRGDVATIAGDYPCHSPTVQRWFHSEAHAIGAGEGRSIVVVHTDITARVLAQQERAAMAANLYRLDRMQAMGTLASGLAHDLKNVLTTMLGGIDLIRAPNVTLDTRIAILDDMETAGKRGRALVDRFASIGRPPQAKIELVALRPLLYEVIAQQRRIAPRSVEFSANLQHDLSVPGDVTQLHQVLTNLATNAWQAIEPAKGCVEITLSKVSLQASDASWLPGLQPGEFARIDVRDNGRGIDAEAKARLFEPFFSTKRHVANAVGGCGIGLAVSLGLVRAHTGGVRVESAPGRGSTFSVYLPLRQRQSVATPSATTVVSVVGNAAAAKTAAEQSAEQ